MIMTQVHADLIRMVYANAPLALIASLLNSAILVYLLWPVVDQAWLISWALATILISLFRLILALRFNRVQPDNYQTINTWSSWALAGALFAGLGWGAASLFLFANDSLPHQVFLAFVIAGTTAGAVSSLSASRLSISGFALLSTLPLAYRFSQASHEFSIAMSLMIVLFTILILLVSRSFYRNITQMLVERYKRKKAQRHDRSRNKVLELLTLEAPLEEILEIIIQDLERDNPEMLCSIQLLNDDGSHLRFGAAPSLPNVFMEYLQGIDVAAGVGCSGSAAYSGKRVIAEDLTTHPYWANAREIPQKTGLRSCWSEPLFSSNGDLLGTFTIYYRQPHLPDEQELSIVKHSIKLASISIERNQTGAALRLADSIYQNTSEAMMITDVENRILAINPAFTQTTGYENDDVIGKDPGLLASGTHDDKFFKNMWDSLYKTGHWRGEIWNRRNNGEEFAVWMTINTIYDSEGKPYRRVSLFSDITERKQADALIWRQANYDSLTKLPNRRLFSDRLEQSIKVAKRENHYLALLFIDLDRFKEVNDTLGHHIGDELLVETAQRINACVRESDTVARLGGDEFTVILNELQDLSHIEKVSQKIIDALCSPFLLGKEQVFISCSIGITVYPDDAKLSHELLKNADQAMFAAKESGRNRLHYFTRSMQEISQQRMRLARDLRLALQDRQFSVYYQAIVSIEDGHIHKAEALLRWLHPEHGFISPADFIPIAEETGAIHEIGFFVFKQATQRIKDWRAQYNPHFQVSINKSPVQFLARGDIRHKWLNYLEKHDVSPHGIVIEITEGVILEASEIVSTKLRLFRDAGMQIAIDDFGTGYSSLAYLKKFNIDYLKLDKSFVKNLETDSSNLALSEAIIVMAHKLGIRVIAEGVETEAQLAALKQIHCDYAQGFFLAKPMPAEEFELLLKNDNNKTRSA